jgi:excinuclease ABC subunit A
MTQDKLIIRGAREHNLKNIDLEIPRDKFVVITGLSGSGKSSLAFDTIYAEGQRRYVESLSAYARQFLGQMEKPDVDQIEGLSPAISIDQKGVSHNPRSTVGTVTEIYDYLRLLLRAPVSRTAPSADADPAADSRADRGRGRKHAAGIADHDSGTAD